MSNPFEAPAEPVAPGPKGADNSGVGPWAYGGRIVATSGVTWPRRCVGCNSPDVSSEARTVDVRWSPGWVYALLFLGVLPYVIARGSSRQTGRVRLFLCAGHEQRLMLERWVVPLLIVAGGIGGMALAAALDWVVLLVVPVAALIAFFVFPRGVVFPTNVRGDRLVLQGASKAFVASLPVWSGPLDHGETLHSDLL